MSFQGRVLLDKSSPFFLFFSNEKLFLACHGGAMLLRPSIFGPGSRYERTTLIGSFFLLSDSFTPYLGILLSWA